MVEADGRHRLLHLKKSGNLVRSLQIFILGQVTELAAYELELRTQLLGRTLREEVEYVVIALALGLAHDAGFFEKICFDRGTHDLAGQVELQHEVLAISRRVVVHYCLCVTKCLEQRRCCDHAIFQALVRRTRALRRSVRQKLEEAFGCLRLACTRLARDDHRLRAGIK